MAFLSYPNVVVRGVSACVPKNVEDTRTYPMIPDSERDKLVASTGILQKRVAPEGMTSSDLCFESAKILLERLGWAAEEVEALIFVSQTPDYILPATSCILQDRLGLSEDCLAFDISLGCSGWVYGMNAVSSIISNGSIKKALLLCGDLATRTNSPRDPSEYPLFGDAGTCTAVEYSEGAYGTRIHLGTDGSGYQAIIIPDGGYRNPFTADSLEYHDLGGGRFSTGLHARMDGMSVFSFAISKAPKSVKSLCERFDIDLDGIDALYLHQANLLIDEKIRKKLKLPEEKVPYSMDEFANSSCATIPVTMVTRRKDALSKGRMKNIGCAFGVGLSWGSVYFETDRITVPALIEI